MNDFYCIGQVIEVRGQKIRIRVFENKNSNILVYKGQAIKNVSVGGFVKIPKGFSNIIGRIEGEYIQENKITDDSKSNTRFSKESETIDRIIEVSIMGIINDNKFKRGLIDIPLVFSDVFILTDEEIRKIFEFSESLDSAVCVGAINDYKEEKLYVAANSLFASHIGIFGNTGSGKSNTLAKIYTQCFQNFKNLPNFSKSKFLLIDFNGEYVSAFDDTKKVYNLSTRVDTDENNKIPIDQSFLEDVEIWSIICEATEKTQKPFLGKCIDLYKRLNDVEDFYSYVKSMIENLFSKYYDNPFNFIRQLTIIKSVLALLFLNAERSINLLNSIQLRGTQGSTFYREHNGSEYWGNTANDYKLFFVSPILEPLFVEENYAHLDNYVIFEFAMKFKYLDSLCSQYINEEHIAPLISRFDNRVKKVKRLFSISDQLLDEWLSVYSLVDVNVEFKKIVPLIICKYYYEKQRRFFQNHSLHIIIDEAHNILSTSSDRESKTWKDYRLETFEEIIKEGRKFGTFLTISSQRPSDISETIISQLHNYFIHRLVNNEDIRAIGKAVAFIDNTSYEMISVLPQGACIFTGIASNFPVLVQVDLLPKNLQPQSSTIDLMRLWSENLQ
jgi:DNA helicase HerA-like ATPase